MSEHGAELDALLWGKSRGLDYPYPLVWHLADTAAVVLALWDSYLSPGQREVITQGLGTTQDHARQLVAFWAGLHDIGKATPPFQVKDPEAFEALNGTGRYPETIAKTDLAHNRASQILVVNLLEGIGYTTKPWKSSPAYRCSQILGGHHGRFAGEDERYCRQVLWRCPPVGAGEWQTQRELLFATMHQVTGCPQPPSRITSEAAVLTTGLVILADWLASQESFLRARQETPVDLSRDGVAKHLADTLALAPGLLADAGLGAVELRARPFEEAFDKTANPLQQSLLDEFVSQVTGPGLLVVTAATGHGKTEAALVAAQALAEKSGATGLYFALPTMATANQMHRRVAEYAERCVTGPASLTLLHSMAWLSTDYNGQSLDSDIGEVVSEDEDSGKAFLVPTEWLRGRNRGLLANLSVGTIDQALMAVLRAKHSALRMLGLSSKVFIIDEAHAYDAYMQRLLKLLLSWLGRMRCPVVLLSATLPSSVARHLTSAYAVGAGRSIPNDLALRYPGWLYVAAQPDRNPLEISPDSRQAVVLDREITLDVDARPVRHGRADGREPAPGTRLAVLRELLDDVKQHGGCAAVVCNTVEDAQRTYVDLRDWLSNVESRPELTLLHARMPAFDREARTEALIANFGKAGTRRSGIVVATQVIEQSLDLDFDLVISDLAPIALLLQRAGRCWRHEESSRKAWSTGPRLVVLDPHNSKNEFAVPRHWGHVYPHFLLRGTHHVLTELGGAPVGVPADVERLVEAVYEKGLGGVAGLGEDPAALSEYVEYQADQQARGAIADFNGVPTPRTLRDLAALHEQPVADVDVATRFGAESARVLACYVDEDGKRWLDAERTMRLPVKGTGRDGRFTEHEVRDLLRRTIPLSANYLKGTGTEHGPPRTWSRNLWLRDTVLLPHRLTSAGIEPASVGNLTLRVDDELGVTVE